MSAYTQLSILLLIAVLISLPALSIQSCGSTNNNTNATTNTTADDTLKGVLLTIVPIVCFGSNYVPVKSFQTGDGVFFQWVMSVAILITGFVTYCIQHFPPFYVEAVIGGSLWSLGNLCVVPIVRLVGLSIGLLIWAITTMVVGWATSTFGMFGIEKSELCYDYLNYIGVAVCAFGGAMIAFVKPSLDKDKSGNDEESTPLLVDKDNKKGSINSTGTVSIEKNIVVDSSNNGDGLACVDSLHPILRRVLGVALGVLSGTFYGFMFVPITVMTTWSKLPNNTYYSSESIDYAFPYTVGIFLMGTLTLVIYCIIKLNKPDINPKVLLPGLISGGIWGIASMVWIYVNGILSSSISFPIVSSGPPIVSSLWGILVFREIRGLKNLLLFLISFVIILCGVMLVSLSKFQL